MRVLVTGAAGFIASNLIGHLVGQGDSVLGIDNLFLGKLAYVEPLMSNSFHFVQMDLLDLESLNGLVADFRPERVWHLAANSDISYGTTDFDLKGGTLVTYNVLEAMRRNQVFQIVFSSSGAVYGEPTVKPTPEDYGPLFPISLYAASKLACEGLIAAFSHNYDIQCWIFRFGNIVGPNPTHGVIYDFVRRLMQDPSRLKILGDGAQSKPYVHVQDCLQGMEFGVKTAGDMVNCYNLAVDDQTSVADIAAWTIDEMNLRNVKLEYTGGPRGWKGDVAQVRLDNGRMRALGWRAGMNSDEASRRSIREIVNQITAA